MVLYEVWKLLFLSFAMLVGCYGAGMIPLVIQLGEDKLKLVTLLGAGLLVGTALAVIIPEGIHALYQNVQAHHEHSEEHGHEHSEHESVHSLIGIALVTGFVFMLLVDQIGGGHSHSPSQDSENGGQPHKHKITATLGLVVHAAADGIALGAALKTSQTHVEMIVFVAIMLHKAPAAFGLTTFLLHDGLDREKIRKHLMVFSLSAPILAIVTFILLSETSKESLSNSHATGLAMLFSAGTFLYVATVHVLPEVATPSSQRVINSDGSVVIKETRGLRRRELGIMVVGSMAPLALTFGHSH